MLVYLFLRCEAKSRLIILLRMHVTYSPTFPKATNLFNI
jgi:hypothetical protein